MVWELLFYAGIGSLAGFFAGLLGIGGGLIIVPLLIILLTEKFSDAYAVQMSVATSLAVIVVTAVPSFLTHAKGGRVFWRIAAWMLTGACVGAPLVAIVAQHIPGKIVQGFLILFMLHHSWHLFFNRRSPVSAASLQLSAPLLAAMGSFVGGMSHFWALAPARYRCRFCRDGYRLAHRHRHGGLHGFSPGVFWRRRLYHRRVGK